MKNKLFIAILTILFIIPFSVFASDGETSKLFINIDIKDNGDIFVQELASLEGEYNGRLRDIFYQNENINDFTGQTDDFYGNKLYNGSSIEGLKLYDVGNRNTITFDSIFDKSLRSNEYNEVLDASNGERGVFTKSESSSGYSLKIFNPSTSNTAFYMEYTIKDAVVVHNDVAELAWNLFNNEYQDNIYEMEAHVNIPGEDEKLKVWLHGPLNGEIYPIDGKYANITYDFIGARNAVSFRVAFDKNLVPNATKFSNTDGLDKIIEVETVLADKANKEREMIKLQNTIVKIVNFLLFGLIIFYIIYMTILKKKSEESDFNQDYYRDIPNDCGPEVVDYLFKKTVSNNAFSASILNIIDKGAITLDTTTDTKDTILIRNKEKEDKLSNNEEKIMDLLFDVVGNGNKVSLKEIKKYGKSYSHATRFIKKYDSWLKDSISLGHDEGYYKDAPGIFYILSIVIILGCVGLFFLDLMVELYLLWCVNIVFGIFALIRMATFKLKTTKGATEYKQWLALKNFMKDFGTMDEKELPEIKIWGKYLVYATVLGCAKQLEKQMQIRVQNMNLSENDLATYYLLNSFTDNVYATQSLTSTLNQTIASAVSSSRSSIAASTSSSGSGGGGGASFGGGSFGGGGGGGHF